MSARSSSCRVRHRVEACLGHIWISDEILNATIQRFGRLAVFKRNVSLAPGPLEARKRETKRRLAHISQVNGGTSGSLDPVLLTGINERASEGQWHWQSPKSTDKLGSIPVTSWVGNLVQHPPPPPPVAPPPSTLIPTRRHEKFGAKSQNLEEQEGIQYRIREHAFLSGLGRCKTTDELRYLASVLQMDVRKISSTAFQNLYESQRSIRCCLGFLDDTSLDDPYAHNLKFLLEQYSQEFRAKLDTNPIRLVSILRIVLVPWVKLQLSLGGRSEADIESLMIFIRDLPQLELFKLLRLDLVTAVLGGLRSSTILGIRDLEPHDRFLLLNIVTREGLCAQLGYLEWNLAKTETDTDLVSEFLATLIQSISAPDGLKENGAWRMTTFSRINDLLQSRSQADRELIIRCTSKRLVEWQSRLPGDDDPHMNVMEQWWLDVVKIHLTAFDTKGLGNLEIERAMPSDKPRILASYAVHLDERRRAEFVLSNWFIGRLSLGDALRLLNSLMKLLDKETRVSPFLCMFHIAHAQDALTPDFAEHCFQLMYHMRMLVDMQEIIMKSSMCYDYHIPATIVMNIIKKVMEDSPKDAHRLFCREPRIPIEVLPSLAAALVEDPEHHANIVWEYRRERPFELAYSALELSADSSRQLRAQFLDTIATEYSKSSKLTPRMARRHVMKCIMCYDRENLGPLSPSISHALVQAGIIRPLRERGWLSYHGLQYVLSVVWDVEGPERAAEINYLATKGRQQLLRQAYPERRDEWLSYSRRKPSPEIRMKRSKTTRRYEQVILPNLRFSPMNEQNRSCIPNPYALKCRGVPRGSSRKCRSNGSDPSL